MKRLRYLVLTGAAVFLTACGNDSVPEDASGEALYGLYCASCHRADGSGSFLDGVPPNRTTSLSEQSIVQLITRGHEGKEMPVFDTLSEEQAKRITRYLLDNIKR